MNADPPSPRASLKCALQRCLIASVALVFTALCLQYDPAGTPSIIGVQPRRYFCPLVLLLALSLEKVGMSKAQPESLRGELASKQSHNYTSGCSLYRSVSDPLYQPAWQNATVTEANLVLEGGGMRGAFTAGVLDYYMDEGLLPQRAIGVSAGALNGFHYVAGARGRSCFLNTTYCADWRYFSFRSFLTSGNVYNASFCYNKIPNKLEPLDWEAYRASPLELIAVSCNIETGETDYQLIEDPLQQLDYVRASASMPLVSRIVRVDEKRLLDGGTSDSVPLNYSMSTGAKKHLVVLTQDASYVKHPNKLMPLMKLRYFKYPRFLKRLGNRHNEYNLMYRQVEHLHETGEIFLIRPAMPVEVVNMEHDARKLFALHAHGYDQAKKSFKALQHYLEL